MFKKVAPYIGEYKKYNVFVVLFEIIIPVWLVFPSGAQFIHIKLLQPLTERADHSVNIAHSVYRLDFVFCLHTMNYISSRIGC